MYEYGCPVEHSFSWTSKLCTDIAKHSCHQATTHPPGKASPRTDLQGKRGLFVSIEPNLKIVQEAWKLERLGVRTVLSITVQSLDDLVTHGRFPACSTACYSDDERLRPVFPPHPSAGRAGRRVASRRVCSMSLSVRACDFQLTETLPFFEPVVIEHSDYA